MDRQWTQWVEAYSLPLFRWALSKTGNRTEAEDLAQEIWLQFFAAAKKQTVRKPEHLLFRIAKFVWCKTLRRKHAQAPLQEPAYVTDHAEQLAEASEKQAQADWLHEKITRLSHLQRETMILFYIDQMPQRQIAEKLNLPESTVRWYLFDTRRKLREEKITMEKSTYSYRPQRLHMGINGIAVPELATAQIERDLLMQNILITCYQTPKTPEEIAQHLGVACAYIEHGLEWLLAQEFVTLQKGRYATAFLIRTMQQENEVSCLFEKHKAALADVIVRHLLANESRIRSVGFEGCDRPMNKLLWLLLYHFTGRLRLPVELPERPYRPDGGQYWPLGFVRDAEAKSRRAGWAYNGDMYINDFSWFGLYTFGQSEIENLMDAYTPYWHSLRELLKKLIRQGFSMDCVQEAEMENLAALIEKGFVLKEGESLRPNFVIFTAAQYDLLCRDVFMPLEEKLGPAIGKLAEDMRILCHSVLPEHLKHLSQLLLVQSLTSLGFETEYLAFQDGHLYQPQTPREGEFLTMAYLLK